MSREVEVLRDADIIARLTARDAVDWIRQAIGAAHRGELVTPPRTHVPFDGGRLTYTAGRMPGRWFGYRSYDSFDMPSGDQIVAIHAEPSGDVAGIAVTAELGPMRVGAIGGVAADALASPGASSLGLIGTGTQAWMQLWAISTVRRLDSVAVYGRDPERRERFAANASERYGLDVRASDGPEAAVSDRDIVVLATNSGTPVVDAAAIRPDAYVTTLGPKLRGRAEFDAALAERAALVVTDSPAQVRAYDPPFVLTGTPHLDRMVSLGAVLAGEVRPEPGTLFCSVGLAGTEAYLLARLVGLEFR
ncbi:MAG TPA: hypothetical protein VE172_14990 [Stackebrandtia sp.]|jgi:ornithine cyclodeaminase|uniref:ornithine cyclodeaminase family protein n=1 Tax=Stackebrandtia sp. TaxID=2023065 RepID=UPI002D70D9BB|nr:hypothetical protein [Stackebrandtia sp.]HZE40111.1 hypothetical protein [Stackebrandtia sp.]